MLQAIAILKAVFEITPLVIQGINTLEMALPQSGQGAVKLDLLKGWLQTALSTEQALQVSVEQMWPAISALVAAVVAANKVKAAV